MGAQGQGQLTARPPGPPERSRAPTLKKHAYLTCENPPAPSSQIR